MIQLTDLPATQQLEVDQDCSNETVENNSEVSNLKQEKSLKRCEEHSADQEENTNEQETIAKAENVEKCSEIPESSGQEVNSDASMEVASEGLGSTLECINKFDRLSLKEGSFEEDEDFSDDFNKTSLDEEPDNMDSMDEFNQSETKIYEVVNEDPETAFSTLENREAMNLEEGSILHCLYQFTSIEKLSENNKLLCDVCTQKQHCGPKTTGKSMLSDLKTVFSFHAILIYMTSMPTALE